MFRIQLSEGVEDDLKRISRHHRNRILDAIEEQLAHEPTVSTRNRKLLVNLVPPWEAVSVVWELRIGDYRVFYDVNETKAEVYIRAVRKKPHGKTTEEIL
jgi:mRNA-degrading endonuclease RelE of RelBE toxin-antitoxin system